MDLSRPPPRRNITVNFTVPPPSVDKLTFETSFSSDEKGQIMEEKTTWNSQTNDDSVNIDLSSFTPGSFLPDSLEQVKQNEVGVEIPPVSVQDNTEEESLQNQEPTGEIRIESSGFNPSDTLAIEGDPTTKSQDTETKHKGGEEETALPSRSDEIALARDFSEENCQMIATNLPNQDSSNENDLLLSGPEPLSQVTEEATNQHPANLDGTGYDPALRYSDEEGMPFKEVQAEDLYQDLAIPSSSAIEPLLPKPTELEDGELSDESDDSEDRLYIDDTKEV